eukprot:TRINITY_DN10390_c0_g2_i1.p1 TRINITY_DN10390_c0_g2~~TRINITY_DN10390_c0_g2_i1.p1  ORF type:complete len:233 (-),score=37.98 TRINITY_DN10390_c0_g2_i1:3-656(-)
MTESPNQKILRGWVNHTINKDEFYIQKLEDLSTGISLTKLVERFISDPSYVSLTHRINIKSNFMKTHNVRKCWEILNEKFHYKPEFSPQDISSGNISNIQKLVESLIQKFFVKDDEQLKDWCHSHSQHFGAVNSFSPEFFKDGVIFMELASKASRVQPPKDLVPNVERIKFAKSSCNVPDFLDPEFFAHPQEYGITDIYVKLFVCCLLYTSPSPRDS